MNKKITATAAILAIAAYALLSSNTYYVSPNGSDTNNGSINAPYKTIARALSVAASGDTVYVRGGEYTGFTVSKSVNVLGYSGENPHITGRIICYRADNVVISGLEVTGGSGSYTGAILLDTCNGATVSYNSVHDNLGGTISGIAVARSNNARIIYNDVYNNAYVGIRLSSGTNIEVAQNTVYSHTKAAGDADCIDLVSPAVVTAYIHHNEVYGCADDGIDTWTSGGNRIEYNVSHDNGGTGDGNGYKLGGGTTGGNNIVIGNLAYNNEAAGFTSNGNGNYYEGNSANNNGGWGFIDSWRTAGSTAKSSFIGNSANGNKLGSFGINQNYVIVFRDNGTLTATPSLAITKTPTPRVTATWTPMVCEETESYIICRK